MKSKLRVVFGIGVFAGLAGGFVVSKKCILKSMEKYLQSDECKNEIKRENTVYPALPRVYGRR